MDLETQKILEDIEMENLFSGKRYNISAFICSAIKEAAKNREKILREIKREKFLKTLREFEETLERGKRIVWNVVDEKEVKKKNEKTSRIVVNIKEVKKKNEKTII